MPPHDPVKPNRNRANPNWVTPKETEELHWMPPESFWTLTRKIVNELKAHDAKSKGRKP